MILLGLVAVVPACTEMERDTVYVESPVPMAASMHAAEVPALEEKPLVLKVKPVALTTQVFESGEMTLAEAGAGDLEAFLQDLNRRKDYDYSQNGGQPGPHSAYLWEWVQKVCGELQGRGYYFDDGGNFYSANGTQVALR
jgi:hypothetical protein